MKFAKLMMAAVVAAGTLFVLTGCGESPSQALQKMVQAGNNGDLETFNKYSMRKVSSLGKGTSVAVTVNKEEINGDSAVLDVTAELTNKKSGKKASQKCTIKMKKVDGIWKVEEESL